MLDAETPTAILPKLTRKKNKFGQEQGPFFIKVGKKKVNLKTDNYIIARDRAREAYFDGKTIWTEGYMDNSASSNGTNGTSNDVPRSPLSDWVNDVVGAAASGLKPDQYAGPTGETVPLLGAIPKTEDEPPKFETPKVDGASSGDSTQIPPEMFKGMLHQLAEILVEVQIQGQEYMVKRAAKRQAGPVPMNAIGRTAATEMWERQFEKWIPSDVPLPEYIVAPLLCFVLTLPVQLEGSTPLAKDIPKSSPE